MVVPRHPRVRFGRLKGNVTMIRLRWAAAVAVLSLTAAACGMGGGDSDDNSNTGSSGSSGTGGGHLVYDSQFPSRAAFAPESDDAYLLTVSGAAETLVRYEADGSLQPGLA